MATSGPRQEKIEEVRKLLATLAGTEAASLARIDDLSKKINFSQAVPYFEEMLDIIKQLNQRDIGRLTLSQLNQIVTGCTHLSNLITKVNKFDINQNTPADVCNGIIDNIKKAYDSVVDPLTIPLAYTATQATDYAQIEREAKGYHTTMKEEAEGFEKTLESYKNEAEKALHAVKEQAAEAGVSTNAQIFLADSTAHAAVAKSWLIATITISVITLLVAIGFLFISFKYKLEITAVAIQYAVSKVILLSTLSFGIFWCARNYKSSKHNETLNKHRANALMTFRAFVEGSEDPTIKDAILLQTAQAAFSNRPTGYENQEKEAQTVSPVVEILGKSLAKTGGTGQ